MPRCIVCDDEDDGVSFTAACGRSYCDDCLASYVKVALEPDGKLPPLCCKLPITLQSTLAHLNYDLVKRYNIKKCGNHCSLFTVVCSVRSLCGDLSGEYCRDFGPLRSLQQLHVHQMSTARVQRPTVPYRRRKSGFDEVGEGAGLTGLLLMQ